MFYWKGINFKVREGLSKCNSNAEMFSVEIENNSKNLIISGLGYRTPWADFKSFKTFFKEILSKVSPSNKSRFLAGDININSLDYSTYSIVKQCFSPSFQNDLTLLINRLTVASGTSATYIDQISTNSFMDFEIMPGIITVIGEHFASFCNTKAKEKSTPISSPL